MNSAVQSICPVECHKEQVRIKKLEVRKGKEYKNTLRPMGIVQVKNIRNGRVYLAASANTAGTINSMRFQPLNK